MAATGGPPSRSARAGTPSAWSAWSWVSTIPPAPPPASTAAATAAMCAGSAGPGSTTHAGSRPTTHVFVPLSVIGDGFAARTSATSITAAGEPRLDRRAPSATDSRHGRGSPRSLCHEPVDRALERDGVDPPARVLAEGGQTGNAQVALPHGERAARPQPSRLDAPAAEVAEHVAALQPRDRRIAHHDAPGDRAVPVVVRAHDHGIDVAGSRFAGRVARAGLERPPAEVRPAPGAAAARQVVDLLPRVLPHVADDEVARAAVEREAPRVAQAERVDLAPRAGTPDERVVARHAVRPSAGGPRIDAQDLPQQRAEVLGVPARAVEVAAAPAVARADVEQAVGTEEQEAAVVVRLGVVHLEDEPRRRRVGRATAAAPVLDHALVLVAVGVVDVEQPAAGVVGRECHGQQALLPARGDQRADVEERAGHRAPVAHHADRAGLLDDEQPVRVARGRREEDGGVEAADAREPDTAPPG